MKSYLLRSLCVAAALCFAGDAGAAVLINEVLSDPPTPVETGDSNNDGTRAPQEDEFVELINTGAAAVDIGGWTLGDDEVPSEANGDPFVFPVGTMIGPGELLVLWGGGTPTGFSFQYFVDDGTIGNGLANGGDVVLLYDNNGVLVDELDYRSTGLGTDVSIARNQSGVFVNQDTLLSGVLYTPGAPNFIPEPAAGLLSLLGLSSCGVLLRRR
ncbi:hypothetical protein Pla123a_35430 [Posidoniimonas polymericola]|uniref:LTD domain-containing protein n=1 Tax=Posidoniimonas polymericola TaxID=2528002 RepID=A0A5C5YE76_9BACT|nr:lamin tail domain-containing protein [Posidoniimonas polymericola]TWT73650.1 hypothetical protein Pla123a_35430 [Posidoniimonas polymericola]